MTEVQKSCGCIPKGISFLFSHVIGARRGSTSKDVHALLQQTSKAHHLLSRIKCYEKSPDLNTWEIRGDAAQGGELTPGRGELFSTMESSQLQYRKFKGLLCSPRACQDVQWWGFLGREFMCLKESYIPKVEKCKSMSE